MVESEDSLQLERIEQHTIVSLKVAKAAIPEAREALQLAAPLRMTESSRRVSLWIAPNHWLLMSQEYRARELIEHCSEALSGTLHNAVDYSSALAGLRLKGNGVRDLLACGTAVDLRQDQFVPGTCVRTRLAQIPALVVARRADIFEIWSDRTFETWLCAWFTEVSG